MNDQGYLRLALKDISEGMSNWRIYWLLGIGDIRQRYARSKLGQFWITLSMVVFIVAIGLVYSALFHQEIRNFLPYLGCNYVIWTLISGTITDSGTVFTQSENYLRQTRLPRTVFVMRMLVRNLMNFAHNIIIIPVLFVAMWHPVNWTILLVPVGLLLIFLAAFFWAYLLGVLCTRFRDMPQIIQSVVQILFFLTPVMWPVSSLHSRSRFIVDYNPFAALMRVASEPMLGNAPSLQTWLMACGSVLIVACISMAFFARFRSRIIYWL